MTVHPAECPVCQFQNAPGSNFCSACGTELPAHDEPTTSTVPVVGVDTVGEGEQAQLIVIRGEQAGARFDVRGPGEDRTPTTIGRHPDSDVFLDDITVSRRHAEVTVGADGIFRLRDVGSMNGTYLDGERVQDAALREGAHLQVGRFRLIFVIGAHGAAT